jgi:hypothetical protein
MDVILSFLKGATTWFLHQIQSIRLCFQNMGTQYTRNRLWKEDESTLPVQFNRLCFQNTDTQYTRDRLWKEDKSKVQTIRLYFQNIRPTVHTEPVLERRHEYKTVYQTLLP